MIRFFLPLLLLLSGLSHASPPSGAVCVVQHNGQLLMVQDRLTGRFSLTGGYIETGESPANAALRELYEETGLAGEVVADLGQRGNAQLFACRTQQPIETTPEGAVKLLDAPNLGGEIRQARLIDPANPGVTLRFPDQLPWLMARLPHDADSPTFTLPDFARQASPLHRAELPWLITLQQLTQPLAPLLSLANLLGEQAFYLVLLPLLLPWLGWPRLRALLFTLGVLALSVTLLKLTLAWPRPFHLDPALTPLASGGFGMPSGHTATALLFVGLLLQAWPRCRHPWRWALLAALLTGLSRIEQGVHFISDITGGLLLGALLLALSGHLYRWARHIHAWWGLTLIALGGAWLTQSPQLAALTCLSAGLSLGQRGQETHVYPRLTPLLALAVIVPCGLLIWRLPTLLDSSLLILILQWSLQLLLGLWLSAGLWWAQSRLLRGTREHE